LLNAVFDDIYKYIAQVGPNYKEFNTVFTSADVEKIITLMAMTMNPKTPNYNKVMDWLKKAALKNIHDLYKKHGLLNNVFDEIYKYITLVGSNYNEFNTVFTSADVEKIITSMTMNPKKTPNHNKILDWLKKAKSS
jgi:uncharacterized protein YpuA (DUF1002 family)